MRRFTVAALLFAAASVASAQMPPSISKPIDAAKKAAGAANANAAEIDRQSKQVTAPAAKPTPAAQAKPAPAKAAPAPAKAAPVAAAMNAPAAQAKSVAPAAPAPQGGKGGKADSNLVTFEREVFTFAPREFDPFASPIETGEIRPLIADLHVVGIIFDAAGRNSVAVLRDVSTQQQYRVKVGQKLGRARVSQIRTQEVVLTIEEYGFSRPETLKLNTTQQTQQTKGKP